VGGSKYTNSNGQAWGYTNQNKLNQNMGSGYQSTSYGYAGKNSYMGGGGGMGGKNVMMYAAGGAAVGFMGGMGAYYMYSRYRSYNRCRHGQYSGSCEGCHNQYGDDCTVDPPNENAHRLELMNTGFWPEDWSMDLVLKITAVTGLDYAASTICPPNGANMTTWTAPPMSDLFFTITAVSTLAEAELPGSDSSSSGSDDEGGVGSILGGIMTLLCCFGCCAVAGYFMIKMKQQQGAQAQNSYGEDQQYGQQMQYGQQQQQYGQPPVVMGQAVGYGANPYSNPYGSAQPYGSDPMGQQQYGQPQYGQPVYQAQPVYAQPVGGQAGGYRPGMAAQ
jgi:hypothetical protein